MKSILQTQKKCFITGRTDNLHRHHIYSGRGNGGQKGQSEKHGFWVYLIGELHNLSNLGVHFNPPFDLWLRKLCQQEYEKTHTRAEFMSIIGRNYLEDGEIVPTHYNPYADNEEDDWVGEWD